MSTTGPRIVVIGSGAGGIAFSIALKRQLKFENFVIYEKGPDIGGTWRENIYPGAASDVNIHFYSLSSDLKPDWNQALGFQPEIQAYLKDVGRKYSLYEKTVFNTRVVSAEWNSTEQRYHIVIENVKTGETTHTTAQILVSATGVLENPRLPSESVMPGIKSFKGKSFHSSRWDYGTSLHGKRVAVIGNGSSASQFVPLIVEDPTTNVTNFWRSPAWFFPKDNTPYSNLTKWMFKNVPFVMRIHRAYLYFRLEFNYLMFASKTLRSLITKDLTNQMLEACPPEYRDKIIPDFPPGCKRLIVSHNYLKAMHRPNLTINWDGIAEIVPEGIRTKKGETLPFDVIIYATGFVTDQYPVAVRGINGTSLDEYYRENGGPQAYLGITIPGFPNFYFLGGPNTATGHTSFVFTEELQIGYSLQLIKPVLEGKAASFEVTNDATNAYNRKLQTRFLDTVFLQCSSWYRSGSDGKVVNIIPYSTLTYRWWLLWPNWSHYKGVNAQKWQRERFYSALGRTFGLSAVGLSLSFWWTHPEKVSDMLQLTNLV